MRSTTRRHCESLEQTGNLNLLSGEAISTEAFQLRLLRPPKDAFNLNLHAADSQYGEWLSLL